MSNAYVLMTAMPPTKGHAALIDFASLFPVVNVKVIICTQPSEPFSGERAGALMSRYMDNLRVEILWIHEEMEQNASAPGFWDMWRNILDNLGMTEDDIVVSSEPYGMKVADLFGAKFIPYDPGRELLDIKATRVRKYPRFYFDQMIPEFQSCLRKTITIFGAESVGKTTLSKQLSWELRSHWRFEWARPYLEMVGPEITDEKMRTIFDGQEAIQIQAQGLKDRPFIIQDTDLFSTIGYWEMWKGERAPVYWYDRARLLKSDLYIIPTQNIPFEEDILRYGGDKRESSDQYWVDLCEREGLNYAVVDEGGNFPSRLTRAYHLAREEFDRGVQDLTAYERKHNG